MSQWTTCVFRQERDKIGEYFYYATQTVSKRRALARAIEEGKSVSTK